MVKHPWPLLEISLSDFRRLATLNIYTYLPKYDKLKDYTFMNSVSYFSVTSMIFSFQN